MADICHIWHIFTLYVSHGITRSITRNWRVRSHHPAPASSLLSMSILNPFPNLLKLIRRRLRHLAIRDVVLGPLKLLQQFFRRWFFWWLVLSFHTLHSPYPPSIYIIKRGGLSTYWQIMVSMYPPLYILYHISAIISTVYRIY